MASNFFQLMTYPLLASAACMSLGCGGGSDDDDRSGAGGSAGQGGSGPDGGGIGSCFVAGTLVATPDGDVPIERLKIGHEVYCYDIENQRITRGTVSATMRHPRRQYLTLVRADGSRLQVTKEHPIYDTERRRFVAAEQALGIAPLLRTATGAEPTSLLAIGNETGSADVFNITVTSQHNYFAGGLLVHNKPRCEDECCWQPGCEPEPPVNRPIPGNPESANEVCNWYCERLDECENTSYGATPEECLTWCLGYILGDGPTPTQECINAEGDLLVCLGAQTCDLLNSAGSVGAYAECTNQGVRVDADCE